MRILLVIYGNINQISGGYLYDKIVIEYLKKKGDMVDIFEIQPKFYLLSMFDNFFNKNLQKILKNNNYDLIIIDELVAPSVFFLILINKNKKKILTLVHHLKISEKINFIFKFFAFFIEKILLNNSEYLVVNSNTTLKICKKLLKNDKKTLVCKPGYKILTKSQKYYQLPSNFKDKVILLSVGNVIKRKNHLFLIECLKEIKNLDWAFIIVGNNNLNKNYTNKILKKIKKYKLEKQIIFTGRIEDEYLIDIYQQSNIFVFPSLYEGYGIVLAESLSFGLPFVGFDCGALNEVVFDSFSRNYNNISKNICGFLLKRNDKKEFNECLKNLISNKELRNKMSNNCEKILQQIPDWDETQKLFYDFVHRVSEI